MNFPGVLFLSRIERYQYLQVRYGLGHSFPEPARPCGLCLV